MFKRTDLDHDAIYGVHDLLRDLCVKESNKESFVQCPKLFQTSYPARGHCLLCGTSSCWRSDGIKIFENCLSYPPLSQDDSRADVACVAECHTKYSHITKMRLVTAMTIQVGHYGPETLEFPTNVRYLSIRRLSNCHHLVLHQMIHLLWNLEICDISLPTFEPILLISEFWEMPRLRLLRVKTGAFLANPIATEMEGNHFLVLKNLQTLECIRNFKCTKEVVDRIPNLKYLSIVYETDKSMHRSMIKPHYSLCNIAQLQKLETLHIRYAMEKITFPNSLKELNLLKCQMAWEDMSIIGSLPALEILVLQGGIEGSEWNPKEGEFVALKILKIVDTRLKCWRADSIHFPVLEKLELWCLVLLEGIPLSIGDIPTLRQINLRLCSQSATNSAREIREEQEELGNETLEVSFLCHDMRGAAKMDEEGSVEC